jgi:adenine phosphoribosyltransferase
MRPPDSDDREVLRTRVRAALRTVPDFPKAGITFVDIMPALADADLLRDVVKGLSAPWRDAGITHVAGIESRGFILGAPMAVELRAGFMAVRKAGKLPGRTASEAYALEYGEAKLEVHVDACSPGARVLIVDDVLATGGTSRAAMELVHRIGGTVAGISFLLSIPGLAGRALVGQVHVDCLLDDQAGSAGLR